MGVVIGPDEAEAIAAAMQRAVESSIGQQFTSGAKVPGVPTAGKSGTAELGGTARPIRGSSASPRSTIRGSRSPSSSSAAGAAGPGRRPSPAT